MWNVTHREAELAVERARMLRDSLTRAVEAARREQTATTAQQPPQRSGWLGTRLRHPFWSLGTIARMPMRLAPVRSAAGRLERALTRAEPLPLTPPQRAWTDPRRETGALHWLGPVTIRHRTLVALLCQPNASIDCRATVTPGARVECACGIAPRAWAGAPPAIDFAIHVASAAGGWTRCAARRLDVTRRLTDRRWHDVRIDLPDVTGAGGEEIVITLSTAVPPGSDTRHADALLGAPRLVWPR